MFPLTHLYCTQKIIKNAAPSLLYGSIFPDIPVTGIIDWVKMKEETADFSKYIKQNNPSLADFAEGLLFHEEPKGIDRFVHGKNGYAIIKGQQILPYIKKHFAKEQLSVAHGFVEFAVEILLAESLPALQDEIKPVVEWAENNLGQIAKAFSAFFKLENHKTLEAIQGFNLILLALDMSSRATAITYYTLLTNESRNTECSEDIIKVLLERTIAVVEKDYRGFLEKAIIKCREK